MPNSNPETDAPRYPLTQRVSVQPGPHGQPGESVLLPAAAVLLGAPDAADGTRVDFTVSFGDTASLQVRSQLKGPHALREWAEGDLHHALAPVGPTLVMPLTETTLLGEAGFRYVLTLDVDRQAEVRWFEHGAWVFQLSMVVARAKAAESLALADEVLSTWEWIEHPDAEAALTNSAITPRQPGWCPACSAQAHRSIGPLSRRSKLLIAGLLVVIYVLARLAGADDGAGGWSSGRAASAALPDILRPHPTGGVLAGLDGRVYTDGSSAAASAVQVVSWFPAPVQRVTIDHVRQHNLTVRLGTGDLSSIAPSDTSFEAIGMYAPGQWVAATPGLPLALNYRPRGEVGFMPRRPIDHPAIAAELGLQRVLAHEWGHVLDDALVPGGTATYHSQGEQFDALCRDLPPTYFQWYATRWEETHRSQVCQEIFADAVARLALTNHEAAYDASGEYRWMGNDEPALLPDHVAAIRRLDGYLRDLIAGLPA